MHLLRRCNIDINHKKFSQLLEQRFGHSFFTFLGSCGTHYEIVAICLLLSFSLGSGSLTVPYLSAACSTPSFGGFHSLTLPDTQTGPANVGKEVFLSGVFAKLDCVSLGL